MIFRWRCAGKNLSNIKHVKKGRWPLTHEMELWATSPHTLQEMAHLGLHARAHLIKERYELKSFSHSSVVRLFKKHGITYRKPQYSYSRKQAHHTALKQ
jgi:transposase